MRQSMRVGFVLLLAVLTFAAAAFSQEVTAGITGTVTDPSGAALRGATATATDTERGTSWTAETNESGVFTITRLPVGTYTVRVTAPGFQTANYPAFTLVLNQIASLNFQMKVGQVAESVEVSGAAPLLQTQTTEVGDIIDSSAAVSMPLASRNYLQLTLLAPGATNVNPDGMRSPQQMTNSGRPYINGNREQANQYFLDGQQNSEERNNEVGYTPSVDAIQEFNVITQNASAEFGNYEGGVISATIKSGTNSFHGDVYEFLRNDTFNANLASNGWTKGVPGDMGALGHAADGTGQKPELRYNQFGATFGGPIIKNKLFFFVDYQGIRQVQAGPDGSQVLTTAMKGGNFASFCASGFTGGVCNDRGLGPDGLNRDANGNPINDAPVVAGQLVVPNSGGANSLVYLNPAQIPATINGSPASQPTAVASNDLTTIAGSGFPQSTVAKNILALSAYPTTTGSILAGNNFFFRDGVSFLNDQGDAKIDYNFSQMDRISGRWSQARVRVPTFSGCVICSGTTLGPGSASEGSTQPLRNSVVSWTHTINANLLNEARIGFNAVRFDQTQVPSSVLGQVGNAVGIPNANPPGTSGLANISITGAGQGNANLGQQEIAQIFHSTQGQFADDLNYTRGRHSIKTGFQYVRVRDDWKYNGNNGALGSIGVSTATNLGLADFYLGQGSGGQRDTSPNPQIFKDRNNIFAVYVQDNWRFSDSLTLNLGIRFEDHTPVYEDQNRVVNFGLFTGLMYSPGGTGDGVTAPLNFSNRALYNNYLGIGDWEPRIGFAWSPKNRSSLVVRGGYAVSSFTEGLGSNEQLSINPPFGIFGQSSLGLDGGFPTAFKCTSISIPLCYAGQRVRITDQNLRPALNQQWNFTVQQQFGNHTTLQLGYVGQHGTHLATFVEVQQRVGLNAQGKIAKPGELIVSQMAGPFLGGGSVPCGTGPTNTISKPTCGVAGSLYQLDQGAITDKNGNYIDSGALAGANLSNANQSYNALQAVLQRRMGNGLQAQVAYTWSKCLSNSAGYFGTGFGSSNATSSGGQPGVQNIYDPRSDWGPCYFDQRQILSSYVTYQLPLGRGKQFGHDMNPVVNDVIGNWEIGGLLNVHSGNQLTLNEFGGWGNYPGGTDQSGTNGSGPTLLNERPDCIGPVKVLGQHVNATGGAPGFIQWFDPSNVVAPAPNTFGTCGVGNIRGPGYADVDLSLHKSFFFTETKSLQFRFEALNAFNHPVWTFLGGPNNGSFDPGSPNFGHVTGSQGARQLQFAFKFFF
ncbi:MAG TPA: TonB-dependent receptor [Candidatus Sulfotelmatobacter sp.]|nr:TonB-dependent receptor [Candidatus Sulfotelmatobacter sp.]